MLALIIPIFNRSTYLHQCFESLKKLTTKPGMIFLMDDCSTEVETQHLVSSFDIPGVEIKRMSSGVNRGVRVSLLTAIEEAFIQGCDTIINLDSDMIAKPHFISEMLKLKELHPDKIISGINCTMRQKTGEERNPLISEHENYYFKKYVAGQCLLFQKEQYERFIKRALQQPGNWDHNMSIASDQAGLPIVVCKPSVAQHIGMESSMGHNAYGELPDKADDWDDRLYLPDVTLFGIDAHNPSGLLRAAEICQREIKFGAVKIITERLFPGANRNEGRINYSRFMIKDLASHFDTSHVLTIHDDGYIQNPGAWKDEWLEWDILGAAWDWHNEHQVGNGGFSLRSKKLCSIVASDSHITEMHPEDDMLCRKYRPYLEEKYGIKFAPVEVAKKFSIEAYGLRPEFQVYNDEFGFHGRIVRKLLIPIQ